MFLCNKTFKLAVSWSFLESAVQVLQGVIISLSRALLFVASIGEVFYFCTTSILFIESRTLQTFTTYRE